MAKRIIQTDLAGEDIVIEKGLRPESLDQYVGQRKAKNNLKILYLDFYIYNKIYHFFVLFYIFINFNI